METYNLVNSVRVGLKVSCGTEVNNSPIFKLRNLMRKWKN
jgi:hypothetical protein